MDSAIVLTPMKVAPDNTADTSAGVAPPSTADRAMPTAWMVSEVNGGAGRDQRPASRMVNGPVRQPDLVETPVFEERLVLVTARRVADLDAVMRDPKILVFRTGCSYRRRLESILRARGAVGVRCMEFGTLDGILGCVEADMGLTLLPAAVVERHASREQVRVHEPPEEEARAETVFVQRVDTPPSPALTRFLTHARAVEQTTPVLRMVGGSSAATG